MKKQKIPKCLLDGHTEQWIDFTDVSSTVIDGTGKPLIWLDKSGNGHHFYATSNTISTYITVKEVIKRDKADNKKEKASTVRYLKRKHNIKF